MATRKPLLWLGLLYLLIDLASRLHGWHGGRTRSWPVAHVPTMPAPTGPSKVVGREESQVFTPRPLTDSEREVAWNLSNMHRATTRTDRPIALWVLGPSSVGKSTLIARIGPKFGIPRLRDDPHCQREDLDAVVIDGEFMRDAHGVWKAWTNTSDWKSAYPALKHLINKEKDMLISWATKQRKNLIIPQTMLNLKKGLKRLKLLTDEGYINHVVGIVAPKVECQERGRKRERKTGKKYSPEEFSLSIDAIPEIINEANGRYEVFSVHACTKRQLDFRLLTAGRGDRRWFVASNMTMARSVDPATIELMALINSHIGHPHHHHEGEHPPPRRFLGPLRSWLSSWRRRKH